MNKEEFIKIFKRDLEILKSEILLFEDEEKLWIKKKSISNSPGNLCLHLIGNLNHFIGCVLGKTLYIRNRELEFTDSNIPVKILIQQLDETIEIIEQSLGKLSKEDFKSDYPIAVFNERNSTAYFLMHLATHLNYHLGQINYFRRLL